MKKTDPKPQPPNLKHTGKESHLFKELMLTHLAMQNSFPRLSGMPTARFSLLRTIAVSCPEQLAPMEIARRLGINAAAITRQLNDMEFEGLIQRVSDPKDARRSYAQLTDKGRSLFEQLHSRIHKFENSLRSTLNETDIAITIKVLNQLRETLAESIKGKDDETSY
jgi:DNA-binding MarR family transcriptional regulator